jgi:transposase
MIGVDTFMEIRDLARQGHSVRAIARLTGLSRNTVRKVLRGEHDLRRKGAPRASKLDPFKDYLRSRRAEHPLSAVRLLEEIRPMGYVGSVITLRRSLATLDDRARREARLAVRFEAPPGRRAQADWAHAGRLVDAAGRSRPLYAFTCVLSYSRMLYVRFTTSMDLATLVDCHRRAFDYLGGWPQPILYDSMEQVRLGPGRWNEAFLDFANHHGFTPRAHRPYRPRAKGKVERAVDYVKDSFLLGRAFADLDGLNARALAWLAEAANVRVQATTGRRPVDPLPDEAPTPAASVPAHRHLDPVRRVVSVEAMVRYRGSRHSVPPAFAGKPVEVAAAGGQIVIRCGAAVIAEHREAARSGQCIAAREHIAELRRIAHEQVARPPRPERLAAAGPEVRRVDLRIYEEVLP